jgi:hypothetical protein
MNRIVLGMLASSLAISSAFAFDDNQNQNLQAKPSTFVGLAAGCAPSPAGSNIVTSAWLTGLGLPDNGSSNVTPSTPPNNDPHLGLLLSKNGATNDCSAAGADIKGASGIVVMATTEFGFDYRNGGHCGAGAPRFNLVTSDNVPHFGGCAGGAKTAAPQDPVQWSRVRLTPAQFFPPIPLSSTIKSLSIILDEGTDTPSPDDPNGIGLAVIDNIDVNGNLITSGPGVKNGDDNGDK